MRLGIRNLRDVSNVNTFGYALSPPQYTEGDTQSIFFQLVDEDAPLPGGMARRYIPATGATLTVILDSVEIQKQVTRVMVQQFVDDRSIWRLDVNAADPMRGTVDAFITLNESGAVHRARVKGALRVSSAARS